jgi:aminoglycoside 6-adenylyltransferase
MRREKEMIDLILRIAREDERIRAVYMNGSRTNPNAPKDIFQDYDIVYVVTEIASFLNDERWISMFGDLIMIQEPDKLDQGIGLNMNFDRSYGYLVLFTDGNRIDLHIKTIESMLDGFMSDKLTLPLLDKDNCLPHIPAPTDNVAKGIWRDELPYAKSMFERTYSDSHYDNVWNSIFVTCDLFRILAKDVAEYLKITYPLDDDRKMTEYLKHVRELPVDAKEIY